MLPCCLKDPSQQSVLRPESINGGTNCFTNTEEPKGHNEASIPGHARAGGDTALKELKPGWGHKANRRETISEQWSLKKYARLTIKAAVAQRRERLIISAEASFMEGGRGRPAPRRKDGESFRNRRAWQG